MGPGTPTFSKAQTAGNARAQLQQQLQQFQLPPPPPVAMSPYMQPPPPVAMSPFMQPPPPVAIPVDSFASSLDPFASSLGPELKPAPWYNPKAWSGYTHVMLLMCVAVVTCGVLIYHLYNRDVTVINLSNGMVLEAGYTADDDAVLKVKGGNLDVVQ